MIAGILLFALSVALLAVVAAAEASVAAASRLHLRTLSSKGETRAERLHGYVERRASTLGALAVVRNLAVVLATAFGLYVIARETDLTWVHALVSSLAVLLIVVLLDALPRLVVARNPDQWGLRLVPVVGLFRAVFGPVASAINRSLARVMQANGDDHEEDETEELLRLAEIETNGDPIEEDERQMIRGIIEMEDTTAREIMAPRIDIVGARGHRHARRRDARHRREGRQPRPAVP